VQGKVGKTKEKHCTCYQQRNSFDIHFSHHPIFLGHCVFQHALFKQFFFLTIIDNYRIQLILKKLKMIKWKTLI